MFKKCFILIALAALSTSAFASSTMKCRLTDNNELIRISYAELDGSGNGVLETDEYDNFVFGAEAEAGQVVVVWSMSEGEIEDEKFEPLELTEVSSRGTEIKFSCDIID